MAYCIHCGAQLAEGAVYCISCGKPAAQPAGGGAAAAPSANTASSVVGGLADNIAGLLAYVTFVPAIIFLLLEPYNKNRFVRFHSFQSIMLCVVLFVIHIVLMAIPLLGMVISMLVSLAALGLWIVLMIKAYNGLMFKVPVIGDFAEKAANAG